MEANLTNLSNSRKNEFDLHSFERKIVELVEELRLRRNLEIENEKTLKICMEEKYKTEMELDEQRAKHANEKELLQQQISVLKRKLEDNVCVSDDEKLKQQIVNKTYSQEIRTLKEELRKAMTEKLNFVKQIQSLEAQLKLHTNYQENIMKQFTEVQHNSKKVWEECEALKSMQKNLIDHINEVKVSSQKFKQYDNHLRQIISILEKKNEVLKKDLVTSRAELALNNSPTTQIKKINNSLTDLEKVLKRNTELEKLFLQSRKENEKTIQNLVESNKQLCCFMNKYADAQKTEKSLTVKIEGYEKDISSMKAKLKQQKELLIQKEKIEKATAKKECKNVEIQTLQTDKTSEIKLIDDNVENHMTHKINNFETSLILKESEKPKVVKNQLELTSTDSSKETIFNTQYKDLTFSEISKRKCSYEIEKDTNEYLLPKKKNCSENDGIDREQNKSKIRFRLEDDKSLPSSLNSSQESTNYFANSESKDEPSDGDKHVQKISSDAETKELMSVEENLQNLQMLDKETRVPTSFSVNHLPKNL